MYLTKAQIADIVKRIGQPKASVLLNRFFQSYCSSLDSSDVAGLYDKEYAKRVSGHEAYLLIDGRYKVNIYNKYTYEYLKRKAVSGRRLLDYGCGDGGFSMASAASLGFTAVGIDFNAEPIDFANLQAQESHVDCHFLSGSLDAIPKDGQFDFVTLNDLVEHLSDGELRGLFRTLRHRLADEGEVVIHTPNGLALCNDTDSSLLQVIYKAYIRLFRGWRGFERTVEQMYYDQVHINIKSYRALSRLLDDCGFECRVIYDNPQTYRALDFLSPNMLVIAKKKS